jgi:hypothetical protein
MSIKILNPKDTWVQKPYAKSFLALARENFVAVCYSFLSSRNRRVAIDPNATKSTNKSTNSSVNTESTPNSNPKPTPNADLAEEYNYPSDDENVDFPFQSLMEKEKIVFFTLFDSDSFSGESFSSSEFWASHAKIKKPVINSLTRCADVAMMLRNIPASSACVERFFSICGIVHHKRAGNMSDSTLENRAFLKTNLKIFEKLIE